MSIATPIARTLPLIIMGLAETQLGITITYTQWLIVGVPFSALLAVRLKSYLNGARENEYLSKTTGCN